jgi:phosphoribosylanthranilate isomerase
MEDALAGVNAGVHALGFVFYPKSPRNVSKETAKSIIRQIPGHVATVGVFVNAPFSFIMEQVTHCGLTAVQLHGQENPDLVVQLLKEKITVIKALFGMTFPGFDAAPAYAPSAFLVECGKGALPGGNAMAWDWSSAMAVSRKKPLILAGGLEAENIARAVRLTQPDAVDVSSGVEVAPGIKDGDKIRSFMAAVPVIGPTRPVF